ncbi:MAG: methyltransferase domain-containing protein [Tidjanibacter sp.]|nr:methyltransferase domain-containing protein [Tidjanibacter sp.]MBQ5931593.1 methyltransferase domain-containing protein [Tidjanibacter sp.]
MKDVFCSYQTETLHTVIDVCKTLESNNISCWYAARDVKENHAPEIVEAIKNCKVFLLFEDDNVATSPRGDVLNEVNMACALYNRGKIKIIRLKLSNSELESADLIYYIGRIQHTDAFSRSLNVATTELTLKINKILGNEIQKRTTHPSVDRYKNDYFKFDDEKEKARLEIQQQFLKEFDSDIYERLLHQKQNICVLDIGSNSGDLVMDRLGCSPKVDKLIGVDLNSDIVEYANQKWTNSKARFYCADAESEDFVHRIKVIMEENGIYDGFDFVNISMVILHLQNPTRLLWNIRKLLKPGGTLFIRDIDDGLNLAYPDKNDYFKRTIQICSNTSGSGFRESGRQIYSLMSKAKFHNIKVENMGINTAGMNDDEKDAFFDVYFSFILEEAKLTAEANPNKEEYRKDYEWLSGIYDDMEEEFHQEDFFFNLGFMAFSATK